MQTFQSTNFESWMMSYLSFSPSSSFFVFMRTASEWSFFSYLPGRYECFVCLVFLFYEKTENHSPASTLEPCTLSPLLLLLFLFSPPSAVPTLKTLQATMWNTHLPYSLYLFTSSVWEMTHAHTKMISWLTIDPFADWVKTLTSFISNGTKPRWLRLCTNATAA